jgi:hypothetical protein
MPVRCLCRLRRRWFVSSRRVDDSVSPFSRPLSTCRAEVTTGQVVYTKGSYPSRALVPVPITLGPLDAFDRAASTGPTPKNRNRTHYLHRWQSGPKATSPGASATGSTRSRAARCRLNARLFGKEVKRRTSARARERAQSRRSITVTLACPPPSHIVCRPRRPPVSSRVCSNVVMSRTPEAPSG